MTNRFFLYILFFTILSSCVSPKLFEETQKEKKELIDENLLLKKEKLLHETKYTELDGKNQILKSKINSLKKDSSKTSNEFRTLNGTYQELSDAYDLLLENNSQMLKSKGKEIKSLLIELQTVKNNLQTKEDELEILEGTLSSKQQKLLQTQKELEDRVQTVIKLESIISKKDSLLDALKKRVSSALLGFEGDGLTVTQKNGETLYCPPIGHRQERGDYQESWQPKIMKKELLNEACQIANKITKSLKGNGIWGVEFFIKQNEIFFSELSPRPHDTGMVTLAKTQNFNEFELHARAILELPISEIKHLNNGASAVILASEKNNEYPNFVGLENASIIPNTDFKIFGKPKSRPYRRMGVALAYGDNDVEDLVKKAKMVASKIIVK